MICAPRSPAARARLEDAGRFGQQHRGAAGRGGTGCDRSGRDCGRLFRAAADRGDRSGKPPLGLCAAGCPGPAGRHGGALHSPRRRAGRVVADRPATRATGRRKGTANWLGRPWRTCWTTPSSSPHPAGRYGSRRRRRAASRGGQRAGWRSGHPPGRTGHARPSVSSAARRPGRPQAPASGWRWWMQWRNCMAERSCSTMPGRGCGRVLTLRSSASPG